MQARDMYVLLTVVGSCLAITLTDIGEGRESASQTSFRNVTRVQSFNHSDDTTTQDSHMPHQVVRSEVNHEVKTGVRMQVRWFETEGKATPQVCDAVQTELLFPSHWPGSVDKELACGGFPVKRELGFQVHWLGIDDKAIPWVCVALHAQQSLERMIKSLSAVYNAVQPRAELSKVNHHMKRQVIQSLDRTIKSLSAVYNVVQPEVELSKVKHCMEPVADL